MTVQFIKTALLSEIITQSVISTWEIESLQGKSIDMNNDDTPESRAFVLQ